MNLINSNIHNNLLPNLRQSITFKFNPILFSDKMQEGFVCKNRLFKFNLSL